MQWGFKSAWSKQPLINAKAETVATTAFKHHLHQRCLIPADGFYEWTADPDAHCRRGMTVAGIQFMSNAKL